MLDPRRLLTFRAVALERSFSRAAEELNLSQPAVSQQVAALERELGTQLLERRPGGLVLTEAGTLALEHAEGVAAHLSRADAQLAALAGADRRQLRIGAFPSALATVVPAAVARLEDAEPELSEGPSVELAARVRSGELHVAVAFQDSAAERREHEGTERVDLFEEPFIAMLPPRHRLAGRSRIRLIELAEDPWLMPSRTGILHRACVDAGFEPRVRYLTTDPLANAALVAAGLCVSITPSLLAGELKGIATPPVEDAPCRQVYALLPSAGATRLARAFVDALRAG